jgi:hypothetical protein
VTSALHASIEKGVLGREGAKNAKFSDVENLGVPSRPWRLCGESVLTVELLYLT